MATATASGTRLPTGAAFYTKIVTSIFGAIFSTCFILLYLLPLSAFRQFKLGKDAVDSRWKSKRESLKMLTEEAVTEVKEKCEQKYKDTIKSVQWDLDISQHCVIGGNPTEATSLVLLLHGFPECWYSWHDVLPQLVNKGHFVVAPDMRGYGFTDSPLDVAEYTVAKLADDNRAIIKHVREKIAPKIQTVTVVGHDWGGVVAGELVLSEPDVADGCVLINIPHPKILFSKAQVTRAPWQIFKSFYIYLIQIPGLFEYIQRGLSRFSKSNRDLSKFGKNLMVAAHAQNMYQMLNYYRAIFLNLSFSHVIRSVWKYGPFYSKAYAPAPMKHVISKARGVALRIPLLQIFGTGDRYVDVGLAQILEDDPETYAPMGCEVVYIEGVHHFVPTAKPTEVATNVHRFIEDVLRK